jgi:hypothetical protein
METLYHVQVIMSQLKLTKPPWVHVPLALTVYVLVHFLPHHRSNDLDVIVEPASIGSMTNEHETQRPVAFLTYRVNGQDIVKGLLSNFLLTTGGLGFEILDLLMQPILQNSIDFF